MLRLDVLAERPTTPAPFPHLTAEGLLGEAEKAQLARDFPDESKTGFFPVEQLSYGPAFQRLLDDLNAPEFSRIVGEKLDRDLADRPKMIVVRKWSAAKDGRPHTDGHDKVATALVYLNDDWSSDGGALRFLEGPGPGRARYGPDPGALRRVRRLRPGRGQLARPQALRRRAARGAGVLA